ncbi:MAG: hypothetical protein GYA17_03695 [Chloroflexi bacterium]|nr:hypothetical protein [Chloroflexota bacterium]
MISRRGETPGTGETPEEHYCIVCEHSSQEIPLLAIEYQDRRYWICPQHFPILIHHPDQLVGRLPGAEKLQGHAH